MRAAQPDERNEGGALVVGEQLRQGVAGPSAAPRFPQQRSPTIRAVPIASASVSTSPDRAHGARRALNTI